MKKFIIASAIAALIIATAAYASTAAQVIPGNLRITSCPGGITPCFAQYSTANPLPVSLSIAP